MFAAFYTLSRKNNELYSLNHAASHRLHTKTKFDHRGHFNGYEVVLLL